MSYGPGTNSVDNTKTVANGGDTINSAAGKFQAQLDSLYAGLNADIVRATSAETITGTDTTKLITPAVLAGAKNVANGYAGLNSDGKLIVAQLPDVAKYGNPNILDNWDFANPVNQRGNTTMSSEGYWLDRWTTSKSGTDCTFTLYDGYIGMKRTANFAFLSQYIDNPSKYAGLTLTISVTVKAAAASHGGSLYIFADDAAIGYVDFTEVGTSWKTVSFTCTLPSSITNNLYVRIDATQTEMYISRIKVEIGSISTLDLDGPMDYATALSKCQRYFQRCYVPSYGSAGNGLIETRNSRLLVPTPVPMRTNPTATLTGNLNCMWYDGSAHYVAVTGYTYTDIINGFAQLQLSLASYASSNMPCVYQTDGSGYTIALSADL